MGGEGPHRLDVTDRHADRNGNVRYVPQARRGYLEVTPVVAQVLTVEEGVDDVERLDDDAQIGLFDLYNRMRDSGGMLLVSGTQSPLHLQLRDDLRTRLGWGLVYQVHGLSDAEKAQALVQHAHMRGFALPPEVTQYLLRHGRRDLPSLMAALDALDEHTLRLHRAPSVPLLKEVLHQTTPASADPVSANQDRHSD